MEEEIQYSTVVFKKSGAAPKEKEEDLTTCSEVKPKVAVTTAPTDDEAAARSLFGVLAACLGILCVLLVVSIGAIVYITVVVMNEQKANLSELTAENQQLVTERRIFDGKTEELSREIYNLTWMLEVILTFNTFNVNDYCPDKKCQPCQKGWIQFQEKCYLFNEKQPWKTWEGSQERCLTTAADLVVIDSQQEQEFLSNHTKKYFDKYHGYWIGLKQMNDKNWVWIDGRIDTAGYWMSENLGNSDQCGLMIPGRNLTSSWNQADCLMNNRFICERDVLIRSK
ncbi:C-type lectin domain family 9 member A-like [Cottoperca gobio]|uniref:C-type lectin domain family 9 member A-like n=1 Tax=Cottoperca gobio TaxID=56716 RepID=A0A6J2RC50_COTGO|nr:C-type lectin domain family 9 member A-like [Cottoperca gobio]